MGMKLTFRRIIAALACAVLCVVAGQTIAASRAGTVREFAITAKKYSFTPDHFEVDQGDHVRFVVTAVDADHGIAIKPLKVKQTVEKGTTGVVEFDAATAGTFNIGCADWCGKGHKSMRATLVVRDAGTR
jgi:cytochrome c oxidase subunit II